MNIREISRPVTAKALNESLAKRFGQKVAIEKFTLEQLQDVRNKIRTKLSQVEMNENFDSVVNNENYQKSKLFLDVLNTAIAERENIAEAGDCDSSCPKSCPDCGGTGDPAKYKKMKNETAKPDYIDIDGDGDKKEPMKKAAKDAKNKKDESIVREGAEDAAELVMAAKDMVDRVTGWMEDTAEMQTESMLELADAIRDEMGSEKSEAFVSSIKPALEALYAAMESARGTLTGGVGMLTGEEAPMDTMGADDAVEPDLDAMADEPALEPVEDDGLGAADAAMGGEEEAGRAKRESKQYSKKKIAETSRRLATTLSKKKDLTEAQEASKLVQVLRTVIGAADARGESIFLHFERPSPDDLKSGAKNLDLNRLMQNVGAEQFDFGTFKAAYDTDPRVKTMVKNFDKTGIEPKTQNTLDNDGPMAEPEGGTDSVGQMAKRATDVGDKL